jgi:hypothetical protein
MSLRSLVRSRWLWAVVLVWWVFAVLGVFQVRGGINWGLPIAVMATLIVAGLKAVESLTRPAQTAQQAAKRRKTRKA